MSSQTHPWRKQTNVASTPVLSSEERSEGLKEQSNIFIFISQPYFSGQMHYAQIAPVNDSGC